VRADPRDRHHDRVRDREPHPGEQVVRQRVAGEPFEKDEREQRQADHPGEVARLAECTGEEHAQHVQDERHDEDEGSPVVRLAYEQTRSRVQ
jgi:hypothetical protein